MSDKEKEVLIWRHDNFDEFSNALIKGLEYGKEYIAELTQEEKEELIKRLDLIELEKGEEYEK